MSKQTDKLLQAEEILEYYDGPVVFTARDQSGIGYICTWMDTDATHSHYICAAVSGLLLNDFLLGKCDLSSLYDPHPNEQLFSLKTNLESAGLVAKSCTRSYFDARLLPRPGYFVAPKP